MGFLKTYNIVETLAAFPCAQPDPVLIALTFLPAVTPALLEWVSFGCRDVMKFRLGKGVPCGRAMRAQVAKIIPPKYVNAVEKLLKWEHQFSYAGQMFLLADLASDTIARWDTLAYQLNGCPDANNIANWQIEYSAAEALAPNIPTAIGGGIINQSGPLGIAWPTGAVVPAGWYVQGNFDVQARAIFGNQSVGLTTWIERIGGGTYDFPANRYPKGYPGGTARGGYTMQTQNTDNSLSGNYVMMAMSDVLALTTDLTATWSASAFPIADWALNPLGCLRDLGIEHIENPANRNPQSRNPGIIDKWFADIAPQPVRGPPGGKPRSKN